MGVSRDCPHFFGYPLLSQEREKLQISNLASTFRGSIRRLKFLQKSERGRIQGLPKFFGYPLLSQEREKLRISYLASTFRGSIRTEAHEKFRRKGSVGVSRDCPHFFGYPLLPQEREKPRFERTFGTFCSFRTELAFRTRSVFFRT